MALTEKQKLFCEEYVANGYKLQKAYMSAFPDASAKTANPNAWRLMKKDSIKQYIQEIQHDRFEALNINADRIAEEVSKLAFGEIDETNNATSKLKALELLGKQVGLYTQKIEGNINTNIVLNIDEEE